MLTLLFSAAYSESYPLLVSTKKGFQIKFPNQLTLSGALGDKHVCFIIEKYSQPQISTIRALSNYGGAMRVCEQYGSTRSYSSIESNDFDFLKSLKDTYPKKMTIDSANECTCKADNYEDGLLIVRLIDEDEYVIKEILEKVPKDVTISFLASTDNLFKH